MADQYGIPAGGDPYPGKIKYLGGNKRKLTAAEVYAVCKQTWPQGKQELAAAVALAESGGSPFIYNTYKAGHFGLFQISRSAWPEFFADGDKWADPVENSKKAYEIYKKQGWGAWQGYTDKKWQTYREPVANAALRYSGKPLGGLLDDIQNLGLKTVLGNATTAVSDAASTVADKASTGVDILADAWTSLTTPALWMRVGYGTLGLVLVAGGLFLIVRNTPAGNAAAGTVRAAARITPAGRAVVKGAS
jgi:hypothetical protein